MRPLVLLCAGVLATHAQTPPIGGKAATGKFEGITAGSVLPKPLHIHTIPYRCEGKPDQVYGKSGNVYYACIKGKEVCSQEKVPIPSDLIRVYDANRRAHDARIKEFRERSVREGRAVSEDPWVNHQAAMEKHRARVAEIKRDRADKRERPSPSQPPKRAAQ